ncbi:MAG TPA: penicillin-binding transpeptidase domain-containing protein, partial [Aggregatilineales bacterium]|nr:penicillin-binding transpeptidase domain-containing protein [Aggregatilineales bacterium]
DTRVLIPQPGQAPYEPRNYDRNYHGPMTMRRALANSYNIPAVQTVRSVGVDYFLAFSERLGVQTFGRDASLYGPAITLGGAEMTLLELTRAYTVFAN